MNHDLIMFFLSNEQPRRIKVIENTLMQRRTVSTLFWGMRYGINDFMGCYPKIDASHTLSELHQLINTGLVVQSDANHYLLTNAGTAWVHKHFADLCGTKLKMNLTFNLKQFRKRFLLAVQIVSEYSYQNNHYYPMLINDREDYFIKQWFKRFKAHGIEKEFPKVMSAFLSRYPNQRAWQFVNGLNGHSITGMTIFQQSAQLHQLAGPLLVSEWKLFNDLVAFLMHHREQYPAIFNLLTGTNRSQVSNSAKQTYQQFIHNYDLAGIARARKIKLSTVKEHLLEVAILQPQTHSVFKRLFTEQLWQQLATIYKGNLEQWQFAEMKSRDQQFDYFYFRLYQILRGSVNE